MHRGNVPGEAKAEFGKAAVRELAYFLGSNKLVSNFSLPESSPSNLQREASELCEL